MQHNISYVKYLFAILLIFSLFSCKKNSPKQRHNTSTKYAHYFSIEQNSRGDTVIKIYNSDGKTNIFTVSHLQKADITIPVNRVVCLSTTHVGFIEALNEQNTIVGIAGGKYLFNPELLKKYDTGKIAEVGFGQALDVEAVIKLRPQIVFVYYFNDENSEKFNILEQAGITVLPINEYMENTPLGRSEWIKLFGLLYDKKTLADTIFDVVEKNYLRVKNSPKTYVPNVLANIPFQGIWYIPGKKSFFYQMVKDAGGKLQWSENKRVINVSIEKILAMKDSFDVLLNTSSANSIKEILSMEPRLKHLKCIANDRVYNNNKRLGKYGGNDFYESGVLRCDLIINDLYNIFQGDSSNLFYYKRLR